MVHISPSKPLQNSLSPQFLFFQNQKDKEKGLVEGGKGKKGKKEGEKEVKYFPQNEKKKNVGDEGGALLEGRRGKRRGELRGGRKGKKWKRSLVDEVFGKLKNRH